MVLILEAFCQRWTTGLVPRAGARGQTLVEYGLLIGLLAIVIIVSLLYLGPIISQLFQNIGTTLA